MSSPGTGAAAARGAAEKLARRQRRRRRLGGLLILVVIAAVGLVATWFLWFRDSSVVAIDEISIVGLEQIADQAEAAEIEQKVVASVGQMTTLNASESNLREDLSMYPRVADAQIETDFPSAATVDLTVRGDGSVLGEGGQSLLIADDGTILGSAEDTEGDLPTLEGDRPDSDSARLQGQELSMALVLGAVPSELRPFVVSASAGEEGIVVDLSNGLTLIFGDDSRADAKWRAAASVIADPNLSGASSIDLTYPFRPAVEF